MTDAVKLVLRFCGEQLGVRRVTAVCDVDNQASARVLEKAGLRYAGLLPQHSVIRGELRDVRSFAFETARLFFVDPGTEK